MNVNTFEPNNVNPCGITCSLLLTVIVVIVKRIKNSTYELPPKTINCIIADCYHVAMRSVKQLVLQRFKDSYMSRH